MSKNKLGQDSPFPKFLHLKIRRRNGVESLTTLEEGEFKFAIDGCINWTDHPTREEIYGTLPKVSKVVRERCLNFAAHCSRWQNESVSELVFWMPSQGTCAQGRKSMENASSWVQTILTFVQWFLR